MLDIMLLMHFLKNCNFGNNKTGYSKMSKKTKTKNPTNKTKKKTKQEDTTKKKEIGIEQHQKFQLLRLGNNLYQQTEQISPKPDYENESNIVFFNEVRQSLLIHSGHTDEYNNHFNIKENFSGNPDYVFQHPNNGNFIVEEKFRRDYLSDQPFDNHKVQLAAFIYKLDVFQAKYGYLLYWY